MRWIWLCPPIYHRTAGCRDTSKNIPNFWGWKIPPAFVFSTVPPLSTAIRTVWRVEFRPTWCANSACTIHFTITLLAVELQVKTSPICEGKKFRPNLFILCATAHNYHQNSVEGYFWTYLMLWISLLSPVSHITSGCCATSKNIPKFLRMKNSARLFTPLWHHFQLKLEQRGGLVLDQCDAQNPPAASICPYVLWFLC